MALLFFAWLHLLVQPCLAEIPDVVDPTSHCESGEWVDHLTCCTMQAVDCHGLNELSADALPRTPWPRMDELLAVLPPEASSSPTTLATVLRATTTGPPLIIRFCSLRN
ncbi:MAG: hypothetical protein QY320_12580 [Gammaproteobacteria bacterium]|nr:MAG: hypothetical protein QY320_12580 [Gammaproteobacteria bacterium]